MQIMNKDISIILLLYHTPKNIFKNLKQYKNFNIYILDQNKNSDLKNQLIKMFPNLNYYNLNKNLGFSRGINFLAKKVKTKYFLCTQPDIIIKEKNIYKLKKTFSLRKDAILAVPKIPQYKNNLLNIKKKIYQINNFIGAIFLTPTKKFISFGMFDERFFFYWEDIDFCERVSKSKFKMYINTTAKALHQGAASVKITISSIFLRSYNFKLGEFLFKNKYKKLKIIKILREPIKFLIIVLLNLIIFNYKKVIANISYILAILKFLVILKK